MNPEEIKTTLADLKNKLTPEDQQKFAAALSAMVAPKEEPPPQEKLWFEDPETVKKAYEKLGPDGFRKLASATKIAIAKHQEGIKIAGDALNFGRLQCDGFMGRMFEHCAELIKKSQDTSDPQNKTAEIVLAILGGK